MNLKIIFAGTPDFASCALKALLQAGHSVIAVYTQADKPKGRGQIEQKSSVKQVAEQAGIPIYQPTTLKNEAEKQRLKDLSPDLMIVAAYGLLLPPTILQIPGYGCINVHASLLPRFRGASPIQQAILNGESQTGISIMQMDEGLDTGDVIHTKRCPINPKETTQSLLARLSRLGAEALLETLSQYPLQTLRPKSTAQDPSQACYAPKISKSDARINWQESALIIDRKIRAFNPWPIAHTYLADHDNQPIRIWSALPLAMNTCAKPGTIIAQNKDSIEVATGNQVLRLLELQLPGAKRLAVQEILKSKSDLLQVGQSFISQLDSLTKHD